MDDPRVMASSFDEDGTFQLLAFCFSFPSRFPPPPPFLCPWKVSASQAGNLARIGKKDDAEGAVQVRLAMLTKPATSEGQSLTHHLFFPGATTCCPVFASASARPDPLLLFLLCSSGIWFWSLCTYGTAVHSTVTRYHRPYALDPVLYYRRPT